MSRAAVLARASPPKNRLWEEHTREQGDAREMTRWYYVIREGGKCSPASISTGDQRELCGGDV